MIETTTTALRQPEGTVPTNGRGCVAGKRCKCPTIYRRCSLFTRYPEYDKDPILVDGKTGNPVTPHACRHCNAALTVEADGRWVTLDGRKGYCPTSTHRDRGHSAQEA